MYDFRGTSGETAISVIRIVRPHRYVHVPDLLSCGAATLRTWCVGVDATRVRVCVRVVAKVRHVRWYDGCEKAHAAR